MSIIGWSVTIVGAIIGIALFEIISNWLFGVKRTKIHPSQDPGYQSRIRWWEYIERWF